jgi:hypothetical protein
MFCLQRLYQASCVVLGQLKRAEPSKKYFNFNI